MMRTKSALYKSLIKDIENIIDDSVPTFTNLGNVAAILKEKFNWFWVGFYKVSGEELILDEFQGPPACVRIAKGKGVCGRSWEENKSLIVNDVSLFDGHIACNPNSKSEIVVPIFNKRKEIVYVLDIDHDKINAFNEEDEKNIRLINKLILEII